MDGASGPRLVAVSDLHVGYAANREIVEGLRPDHPGDWLLVAGDVCETVADLRWALGLLRDRFARVVWAPGNHELWTHASDEVTLRGVERYDLLVEVCRDLGVDTPEDPWPVWEGAGGPAVPYVFVTHWPLVRAATRVLRHQEFAQWCGTDLTADWHTRFPTVAAVYGHLHIPRRTHHDGVPFHEVSLGYPKQWRARGRPAYRPREILPARPAAQPDADRGARPDTGSGVPDRES